MIDSGKLEALRQSALADDWKSAADIYLEIALEAKGTPDSARIEAFGAVACLARRRVHGGGGG